MSNYRKALVLAVAAFCLVAVVSVGAQEQPVYPVGTIKFETTSIAAGIGVTWGGGTFTFQGKQYPISVGGLGVGAVGISTVSAIGDVYYLTKASDLAGTYYGITGGIAIAGGVKGILAKNQNGVVLDISATQKGVNLTIGVNGFTINMK
jgi:hypothetical protein